MMMLRLHSLGLKNVPNRPESGSGRRLAHGLYSHITMYNNSKRSRSFSLAGRRSYLHIAKFYFSNAVNLSKKTIGMNVPEISDAL